MADAPEGYHEVSPENRTKAEVFFGHGRSVANNGNFDYAIEMFLNGLNLDPNSVEAHQELRDISMKRKVTGGNKLGMMEAMKLNRPGKDDKANMLAAEKLLAYDPGKTDYMLALGKAALKGGFYDAVMWIGPILQQANHDDKKPDANKYLALRDIYKDIKQWRHAADAAQLALQLRPLDMDLATEIKNLAAMETMHNAGYAKGGRFTDQIRDKDKQTRLLDLDKDVNDMDLQSRLIAEAEVAYKADPNDVTRAMRFVDALEKTELMDAENRAVEVLQQLHEKTGQFRYRQRIGQVHMKQLERMERAKRAAVNKDPENQDLKKDYADFKREQEEFKLKEYSLAAEAYPSEMRLKFQIAQCLYSLGRYQEAIPIYQQARNDPKFKVDAGIQLGLSFLQAGFAEEADDTLGSLIRDYQLTGDAKSKEMYYWRARALEQKGMNAEAINHYSKVAQWDFNYRDTQARIKRLRS